ncbi:MAG: hypothetical protein RI911_100 [Candidatus Parcubacteria bacterium]|jgi:hypothetical protein
MHLIRTHWIISLIILTPLVLFAAFMAFSFYVWGDDIFDQAHADRIRAIRLTESDVAGEHLPPVPNQAESDATVVGIDANDNLIRDDVELALFTKYPGDEMKRERAAALQYAQAEQLFFMWVIGKLSMEAYLEKDGKAYKCLSTTLSRGVDFSIMSDEDFNIEHSKHTKYVNFVQEEMNKMIHNTSERALHKKNVYEKYMSGYNARMTEYCDIII